MIPGRRVDNYKAENRTLAEIAGGLNPSRRASSFFRAHKSKHSDSLKSQRLRLAAAAAIKVTSVKVNATVECALLSKTCFKGLLGSRM